MVFCVAGPPCLCYYSYDFHLEIDSNWYVGAQTTASSLSASTTLFFVSLYPPPPLLFIPKMQWFLTPSRPSFESCAPVQPSPPFGPLTSTLWSLSASQVRPPPFFFPPSRFPVLRLFEFFVFLNTPKSTPRAVLRFFLTPL